MLGSGPEWKNVVQAPWKFVSAVSIDSLEKTSCNPEVHGNNVEVSGYQAPDDWDHDSSGTKNHGFDRRSVFCSESERRRILVMDLVNISVEESLVKESVHPVVPCILQDKKDGDLEADCLPRWEWYTGVETARLGHWMEQPDLRKLNSEMREENQVCALPLLLPGRNLGPLNLVFVEVWYRIDYDPRDAAAKVDSLVHDETHDTGRKDIILHVGVPTL